MAGCLELELERIERHDSGVLWSANDDIMYYMWSEYSNWGKQKVCRGANQVSGDLNLSR